MRTIEIFDTTLRDGEQSPGVNISTNEKVEIALQLEKLGVNRIEAGFAAASRSGEAGEKLHHRKSRTCRQRRHG